MAKSELRLKAIELRKQGISVREITHTLGVAKSSASTWTRDVSLTIEQLEHLHNKKIKGAELGRIKSANFQKQKRIERYDDAKKKISQQLLNLTKRERLLIGSALYWAEGTKKGRRVDFCNSDQYLVKFMVNWFKEQFRLTTSDFRVQLGINEAHIPREDVVKAYWSNITEIPLTQFTKTSFKKAVQKKVYANYNDYYGTPKIYVNFPSRIHPRILGLVSYLQNQAG